MFICMCDTWYKHEGKSHLYLEGYGPLLGFGFGQELLEEMKTAQVEDGWMMRGRWRFTRH